MGGGGLLALNYKSSPYLLISTIFPEYEWLPWKFNQTPNGFWNDLNNQRQYVNWKGRQLGIINLEDWYKVATIVGIFKNNCSF